MAAPRFTLLDDSTPPGATGARASVVSIGNFDGVHRGHQSVLAEATREAHGCDCASYVLTFDPHPADVIGKGAPPLLMTLERRAELLVRAGAERVFVRRFDHAFAAWSPERFASELLAETLKANRVVVGENFRFGADRAGDLALLESLGKTLGFEVGIRGLASDARGRSFSSTRARQAIGDGDLTTAREILGHYHAISGVVGRGAQRGRTIGFPTANVEEIPELVPPNGVYAVLVDRLDANDDAHALATGVMNIGVRPTVDSAGAARSVEVHLFDLAEDLYGARLRVHIVARLRDEKKLRGLDELKAQIALDAAEARKLTASPFRVVPGGPFG
jgi:riboflavin kinase/FMN adenylyltransferase